MPDDFDVRPPKPDSINVTRVDPIHERQALQAYRSRNTPQSQNWGAFCFMLLVFLGLVFGAGYALQSGWLSAKPTLDKAPAKIEAAVKPVTDGIVGQQVLLGEYLVQIDACFSTMYNDRGVRYAIVQGTIANATKEPVEAASIELFLYDHYGNKHASIQQGGSYKPNIRINPMLGYDQTWAFLIPAGIKMERGMFELKGTRVTIDLNTVTPEIERQIKAQERDRQAKAERDLQMKLDFEAQAAAAADRGVQEAAERQRQAEIAREAKAKAAEEQRLADVQAQYELAVQRLPELQRQLDSSELKLTRARKSIENISYDRSVSLRESASIQRKIDQLQATVTNLRQAVATSGRQDSQYSGQLGQALREQAAEQAKLTKVEEYLRQLERELIQARADAKNAEKEKDLASNAVADCKETIAQSKNELKQQNQDHELAAPPPPPPQE
ncbi:MAG: hypothetical protein KIS92_04395 [Planctomycetota bacterium]|nr:hypothetical protein [Planctomycetota bacterium]